MRVSIKSEPIRSATLVVVEEVKSGDWTLAASRSPPKPSMQCSAGRRPEQGARDAYSAALTMLHTGQGAPMATIEQALLADPGFVSRPLLARRAARDGLPR